MSRTALAEPAPPPTCRPAPGHSAAPDDIEPHSEAGLRVSEETYWEEYYLQSDIHYEWNNGVLEEKPVSDFETFCIYAWLQRLLATFLVARPIGKLVGLEMAFRLRLANGVVIRRPDLAVVRHSNPAALLPLDVSYHGVYDLCIEALSTTKPAHSERDTVQKRGEYAAGGVPEYYILHPDPARQAFYFRNLAGRYESIPPQDGVIQSRVLPGFQFRLADLLTQPADEALRDDPVYAGFVLTGWRAERERAEAERARAERLAAKLRALGMDPE